jgi:hypothetical protein
MEIFIEMGILLKKNGVNATFLSFAASSVESQNPYFYENIIHFDFNPGFVAFM